MTLTCPHCKRVIDFRERDAAIIAAYSSGQTLQEVGLLFGLTRARVCQILSTNGIPRRRSWNAPRPDIIKRTDEKYAEAKALYLSGIKIREISELTGMNYHQIRGYLRMRKLLRKKISKIITKPNGEVHYWCNSCKKYKPLEMFTPTKLRKDGRVAFCKECMNRRSKESRTKKEPSNVLVQKTS